MDCQKNIAISVKYGAKKKNCLDCKKHTNYTTSRSVATTNKVLTTQKKLEMQCVFI